MLRNYNKGGGFSGFTAPRSLGARSTNTYGEGLRVPPPPAPRSPPQGQGLGGIGSSFARSAQPFAPAPQPAQAPMAQPKPMQRPSLAPVQGFAGAPQAQGNMLGQQPAMKPRLAAPPARQQLGPQLQQAPAPVQGTPQYDTASASAAADAAAAEASAGTPPPTSTSLPTAPPQPEIFPATNLPSGTGDYGAEGGWNQPLATLSGNTDFANAAAALGGDTALSWVGYNLNATANTLGLIAATQGGLQSALEQTGYWLPPDLVAQLEGVPASAVDYQSVIDAYMQTHSFWEIFGQAYTSGNVAVSQTVNQLIQNYMTEEGDEDALNDLGVPSEWQNYMLSGTFPSALPPSPPTTGTATMVGAAPGVVNSAGGGAKNPTYSVPGITYRSQEQKDALAAQQQYRSDLIDWMKSGSSSGTQIQAAPQFNNGPPVNMPGDSSFGAGGSPVGYQIKDEQQINTDNLVQPPAALLGHGQQAQKQLPPARVQPPPTDGAPVQRDDRYVRDQSMLSGQTELVLSTRPTPPEDPNALPPGGATVDPLAGTRGFGTPPRDPFAELSRSYDQSLNAAMRGAANASRLAPVSGGAMSYGGLAAQQAQSQYARQLTELEQAQAGIRQRDRQLDLFERQLDTDAAQWASQFQFQQDAFRVAQEQWAAGMLHDIRLRQLDANLTMQIEQFRAANNLQAAEYLERMRMQMQMSYAAWVDRQQPSEWLQFASNALGGLLGGLGGGLGQAAGLGLASLFGGSSSAPAPVNYGNIGMSNGNVTVPAPANNDLAYIEEFGETPPWST